MNGISLPTGTLGTIRPDDREMPRSFSIKLHSETRISGRLGVDPLDMPRAPYRVSEGKPTMPYHPHPHIIICTSFISSIDYNVFIVLQCHLKDHLCGKVTQSNDLLLLLLRVGSFHQLMSFIGAGCKLVEDAGLDGLWATVYDKNSLPKMMESTTYTRHVY